MGTFGQIVTPGDGVAWVTGASTGIGREIALQLAAKGWTVYATARRTDRLETIAGQAADPGRIIPAAGDVTDPVQMRAIVERITSNDTLVLAILKANQELDMPARNFNAETARDIIDVNILGVTNALDPVMRAMVAAQKGHIAIMSSAAGFRGLPGSGAFCAAKAALNVLAESLAMELTDHNVRLSVVSHGFIAPDKPILGEPQGPFQMTAPQAAAKVIAGLQRPGFEIAFPWPLVRGLRLIGHLPNRMYFALIRRLMGYRGY